jgi:hypothetical protein
MNPVRAAAHTPRLRQITKDMTKQKQDKKSKIKARASRSAACSRPAPPRSGGGFGRLGQINPSAWAHLDALALQAFIKSVNYNHMMPTRYVLDLDLKATVTTDCTETVTKRVAAGKEAKKLLEERYKSGKNRCVGEERLAWRGEG